MKKREQSALNASDISSSLRCPLCHETVTIDDLKSIKCCNNHTFDFAKQGYVNMLQKPVSSQYDDTLFHARHNIITEADLYEPIHKKIAELIQPEAEEYTLLFDAGSGEGSHLQSILDQVNNKNIRGIGLDISKEGIIIAGKHYDQPLWFVGDLANPPLKDQSCKYILNFLSPANYSEFKRILTQDGLIIKIIPGSGYLQEIRHALFNNTAESQYENNDTVELMKKNVEIISEERITYTKNLDEAALKNLISMTPLGWHAERDQIEAFSSQGNKDITVDMHLVIAKDKQAI